MADNDLDLLIRNYRRLTPQSQTLVREQAAARAKTMRAEMLRDLLRRFRSWRERKRAINRLSALDDDMLKDIGIQRGAIEGAVRPGLPERHRIDMRCLSTG